MLWFAHHIYEIKDDTRKRELYLLKENIHFPEFFQHE